MNTRGKEFWDKWIVVCGNDQDLAIMLLEMFIKAISKITLEVKLLAYDREYQITGEEIDEFHRKRLNELMGDFSTEEQVEIIVEDISKKMRRDGIY